MAKRSDAAGKGSKAPAGRAAVQEYFARLTPDKRAALERFRRRLKALLPRAEECLSYGIPAFRHPEGVVVYYAAMKNHLSFFPTSHPIEACARELEGYATSRGTIRFPAEEPLPEGLLKKLVRVRLEQMAERPTARKMGPAARRPAARKRKTR
jgi:uncharacterized protein YdhG (YjbR/CyaY superfamily)